MRMSRMVTKGSGPSLSVNVNGANNRITTSGYDYDGNGNLTSMPPLTLSYDIENRFKQATHSSNGTDQYGYDPSNRRVWKKKPDGTEITYFYGVGGKRIGTYSGGVSSAFVTVYTDVYFAGRLIWTNGDAVTLDRLGSMVTGSRRYFPYGEEKTTSSDRVKFGTYYRDGTTGLDYADQRYYARTIGRFVTADPYSAGRSPGNPADPQSWNRYGTCKTIQ